MKEDIVPEKILKILSCPNCGGTPLSKASDSIKCKGCGKLYSYNKGIPDLTPDKSMRMPKLYDDPDYIRWGEICAEAHDYFYRSKGLIPYIQNAGHREIVSLQGNRSYDLTLDLGCGDGAHYKYLKSPENSFGIDLNQKALEILRSRCPDFFVIRGDGYFLPIRDESVDCIINIYNLEHMVYLDLALEEISRVLTPGGDAFLSIPNEGGAFWGIGRNMTTVRKFTDSTLNYSRAVEIEHINCIWQLEKAFKRYFEIKRRVSFPFHLPSFHLNLVTTYHCVKRP